MKNRLYQSGIGMFWVIALLVFVNCTTPSPEGVLTGGGRVDDGNSLATFTFQANNCGFNQDPPIPVSGKLNYNDLRNDPVVQISGDVTSANICNEVSGPGFNNGSCDFAGLQDCPVGGYIITFEYEQKKKGGGTGEGAACLVDNGRGRNSTGPDEAQIVLNSGPLAGYSKEGLMTGNAQVMFCN